MKQQCERCNKNLQDHEKEAFICSYECTFCRSCSEDVFKLTCPNCTGELVIRPSRINSD